MPTRTSDVGPRTKLPRNPHARHARRTRGQWGNQRGRQREMSGEERGGLAKATMSDRLQSFLTFLAEDMIALALLLTAFLCFSKT